jgi:hypothetical protein
MVISAILYLLINLPNKTVDVFSTYRDGNSDMLLDGMLTSQAFNYSALSVRY